MRPSRQLAIIVVLGAVGYGAWYAHREGHLGKLPVVGSYLPQRSDSGGAAGGPGGRSGPSGPAVVEVDRVRTARIVETREAVGTARALESITVTAKVAGIIDAIEFEEGQKVRAGDVLLRLDAAERRADIEQAVAETRRATAQRNEVQQRLDRAQTLRRSGAGTGAQVEDLALQVNTLDSAIASAEARRKAAEARLEDIVVRAPFAGRIGSRAVSLGAYIAPGTRITTLDDLSRIRLDFSVPENLLGRLAPGQTVRARAAAFPNRVFTGQVSLIDTRVDPATRTVRLTAEFDNADETLRPGMFLAVALEVMAKDNATVVPEEAVVSEGLRQLVFVVRDNTVDRRVIRVGQRQDGKVEVLEGVSPGETIVVRGVQRVRPGAPVDPRPVAAPAAAQQPGQQPAQQTPQLPSAVREPVPATGTPRPRAMPHPVPSGSAVVAERRE